MSELFFIIVFYYLILFSIIGYGRIVTIFNQNYQATAFDGLTGISILILISFVTNIFFPHNLIHNSIIILIGLSFFIFDLKNNYSLRLEQLKISILFFSIILIGVFLYKNHDDFYYYHFQYSLLLTNFEKIFGLGNLNHGFRTPSSIFYLNSLFYLPGIKYYLMNSGAIYIFGFVNLILIEIIQKYVKKNYKNFIFFLSILTFIYINTKFSRFSEHGTDISAMILVMLMAIHYFENINKINQISYHSFFNNYFIKMNIIFILIISLKTFYIIYLLIYFAWLFENRIFFLKKDSIIEVVKNFSTYIFLMILFFVFFTIFTNTGCLIYPASFSCFDQFSWSIPQTVVEQMSMWYEQWSKAGAGPNFRVENPEKYIMGLNWVSNWLELYFFNKITDNLLVIIIITLISFFVFTHKKKKQKIKKSKYLLFYILLLILLLEWFYNHPALRYGGYSLLALIFFIPISLLISKYKMNFTITKKKTYILIFVSILIFLLKNIVRINYEVKNYGYEPIKKPFFYMNTDGFLINDRVNKLYNKYHNSKKAIFFILNKDTMVE